MLRERVDDESLVRVEHRSRDPRAATSMEAFYLDSPAHGVVVQTELRRDRADLPMLRVEETTDLRALLARDHRRHHAARSRRVSPMIRSSYPRPPTSENQLG